MSEITSSPTDNGDDRHRRPQNAERERIRPIGNAAFSRRLRLLHARDDQGIVEAQFREPDDLRRHVLPDTREPLLVGDFRPVPGFVGTFCLIHV